MKFSHVNFREIIKNLSSKVPLSDRNYIQLRYFAKFGKLPDLRNPQSFNEKIQWLKLFVPGEQYAKYGDKFLVRDYVSQVIGNPYLNQIIGVYDNEEVIPFEHLPEQFVLKATHGSGWNIICKDKSSLNIAKTKKILKEWLQTNYYSSGREPIYRTIKPRIVCEGFLEDARFQSLPDYKFFCFSGKALFIQLDAFRFTNHQRNMYSPTWNLCPLTFVYPNTTIKFNRPHQLEEMISIAEKLAQGFPFIRVDLYSVNNRIYFGEMTFYPESGFGRFVPFEWDRKLGEYLQLPQKHADQI